MLTTDPKLDTQSPSVEDYLVSIYRLQGKNHKVNTGELAQKMGVSAASTSAMFKKLRNKGLLNYHPYEGVDLTEKGMDIAISVVRRHRIIERFLTDVLEISWDQVDRLAHQMEHAFPDEVLDRLDAWLGGPETCPHGYPIPMATGEVKEREGILLFDLQPGQSAIVVRVAEDDPNLLRYLKDCNLVPGSSIVIQKTNPVDGTMQLLVDQEEQVIGPRIAASVTVMPSSD